MCICRKREHISLQKLLFHGPIPWLKVADFLRIGRTISCDLTAKSLFSVPIIQGTSADFRICSNVALIHSDKNEINQPKNNTETSHWSEQCQIPVTVCFSCWLVWVAHHHKGPGVIWYIKFSCELVAQSQLLTMITLAHFFPCSIPLYCTQHTTE